MSQNVIEYQINDTKANKNGEASSKSSDVFPYLDIVELLYMRDAMKQQSKKRVPLCMILTEYEKFFVRKMSNVPQMVKMREARVDELEADEGSAVYDQDWWDVRHVKPVKINKAVA